MPERTSRGRWARLKFGGPSRRSTRVRRGGELRGQRHTCRRLSGGDGALYERADRPDRVVFARAAPRIWRVPAGLIRWTARCGLPLWRSERLVTNSMLATISVTGDQSGAGVGRRMPIRAEDGMRRTVMSFETTKGTKNTE